VTDVREDFTVRAARDGLVGPVGGDLETPLTEAAAAFLKSYLTRLPADHSDRRAGDGLRFRRLTVLAKDLAGWSSRAQARHASLPVQFEADGAALPKRATSASSRSGTAAPVAIIETTEVRLVRSVAVERPFDAAEGEGDALAGWRAAHTA